MHARTPRDIGRLVCNTRHLRKIRQADLARQAGVSRQWIIGLEQGRPGLDLDLVMRVYGCLGLEVSVYPTKEAPDWIRKLVFEDELRKISAAQRPRRRGSRARKPLPAPDGLAANS